MPFKDYLPDFKGTLNTFYEEKLKTIIEQKSSEYKEILAKFQHDNKQFQNTVLIILLAVLSLTAIHYFWPDDQ